MGAKTIKSKLDVADPKDKKTKVTFEYTETKSSNKGAGPRGIQIWIEGERGKHDYDIEPNPHDNKKYNKQQAAFYETMAAAVGAKVMADKDRAWPKSVSNVKFGNETYKLS
jgi:hypothetical protein